MKKRLLFTILMMVVMMFCLSGCGEGETVPKETNLPVLSTSNGNELQNSTIIENDMELITTYNTGDYNLARWRITDSKMINMSATVKNMPENAKVLIEHVHIDMSLKSTDPQLDGLSQDNMDDSFHGTSQDGFWINEKYNYQNKFAIEGFSKDLIDGWMFICGDYGSGSISQTRLTEENLVKYGRVYANKMQVVYDIIIKYEGEEFYHTVSVEDEFLIPVESDNVENDTE